MTPLRTNRFFTKARLAARDPCGEDYVGIFRAFLRVLQRLATRAPRDGDAAGQKS